MGQKGGHDNYRGGIFQQWYPGKSHLSQTVVNERELESSLYYLSATNWWNHRMICVEGPFKTIQLQLPCHGQGTPSCAQSPIQPSLERCQRGDIHNFSWQKSSEKTQEPSFFSPIVFFLCCHVSISRRWKGCWYFSYFIVMQENVPSREGSSHEVIQQV